MKSKPLTVADLQRALEALPPETEVWMKWWGGFDRIDSDGEDFAFCPIEIYEQDGVVRLCIDDGESAHPEMQTHITNLIDWLKGK